MGLPDTSLTAALASGGREHYGWGVDRHLAADTYDALNLNTRATGNWRKKPPDLPAEQLEKGRYALQKAIDSARRMLKSLDEAQQIAAIDMN